MLVLVFSLIRNCRTAFQSDCAILYSLSNAWMVLIFASTWSCYYFLFLAIPIYIYIYTVISCHSFNLHFPNGYDVGHLFMCLSALSVFSSVKCMFMSFLHSLVGLFFFFFTVLRVLYIILNTSALLATWFANIFSQPAACVFVLFIGKFHRIKVFNFDEVQFVSFPSYG